MARELWTTTIVGGPEWANVEDYATAIEAVEKVKAEAEEAFRAALEAGRVLVETWVIGDRSRPCPVKVWTGREVWHTKGYETAAHVANRFRAGWTRVEVR